ncbi:hypothetical protein H4219_002652 [Mycoemilia scoparia]|uniref:Cation-transporting P-type ATPase N-terminal domain-containing protein n=1 Tax=Mycoemilia scoparia TaxID=417184 RepID=A0A9W8A508_9FUNG|nr:hypothetical protein H4219_002652 [Mycoemilia scoparia]
MVQANHGLSDSNDLTISQDSGDGDPASCSGSSRAICRDNSNSNTVGNGVSAKLPPTSSEIEVVSVSPSCQDIQGDRLCGNQDSAPCDPDSKGAVEARIGQYIHDLFDAMASPPGIGHNIGRQWKRMADRIHWPPSSFTSSSSSTSLVSSVSTSISNNKADVNQNDKPSIKGKDVGAVSSSSSAASSAEKSSKPGRHLSNFSSRFTKHLRSKNTTANSSRRSSVDSSRSSTSGDSSDSDYRVKDSDMHTVADLGEVLSCLQYEMERYIKGGRLPGLDEALMRRLCSGLLLAMGKTKGSFVRKKYTTTAMAALSLFGQFIEEVATFRDAVGKTPILKLRRALDADSRFNQCKKKGDKDQEIVVAIVLHLTANCFPASTDWKDFVSEDDVKDVGKIMDRHASIVADSCHIPSSQCSPAFPPPLLYYDRPVDRISGIFDVQFDQGLSIKEAALRAEFYGENMLPKPKPISVVRVVWGQLTDFMVLLLFGAIVATGIDKDWKSSIVLAVVILINTIVGSWQEIKAGKAISALGNLVAQEACVLREGTLQTVDASELVPGDVVELNEGDQVPADVRLIECSQFEVIESLLTGESEPVIKKTDALNTPEYKLAIGECTGNAFMSSMVSRGRAKGVVVRTGLKTEIGKISAAVSNSKPKKTPIQRHLQRLGLLLIVLAITMCALIVIIGCIWGRKFSTMFITGLSLAVSVVPEGLVAVTTITMAFGVRRMAQKNALVRVLPSVETLGSVTVICSDKTGTLTEGKMCPSYLVDSTGSEYMFQEATTLDPQKGRISKSVNSNEGSKDFDKEARISGSACASLIICALCNNSNILFDTDEDQWISSGDPTEVALLSAALKGKASRDGWKRLTENPFDSDRKIMSITLELPGSDEVLVLAKGAPEQIVARCSGILSKNPNNLTVMGGQNEDSHRQLSSIVRDADPLTRAESNRIGNDCASLAGRGLRVLGLAAKLYKKPNSHGDDQEGLTVKSVESDLVFAGLIAIRDPVREGVKGSISACHSAGIRVSMITGDHLLTAKAIAMELGIFNPNQLNMSKAVTGEDISLLSEEDLAELDPFPVVFARVSPENKLSIVRALQHKGHQVLFSGDGCNDAPAIKRADVGVAMGQGGSDITKQVAEVVLSDNNFTTITAAIKEGRHIFDNILKFIVYLLSCNTAEVMLFLFTSLINVEMPFTIIMILWANIIADIPPALSIGVEPCEIRIMTRPPRHPKQGIMNRITITVILLQAFFMASITFAVYLIVDTTDIAQYMTLKKFGPDDFNYTPTLVTKVKGGGESNDANPNLHVAAARSVAFGVLTVMQLNQAFLSRSVTESVFKTGITSNKWMIGGVFFSFVMYILGSYTPGWREWLNLVPLAWPAWIAIIIAVIIQIMFSEMVKAFLRRWYIKHPTYGTLEVVGVPDHNNSDDESIASVDYSNEKARVKEDLAEKAGAVSQI